MAAYYNEVDPNAAAWLRTLISQGHIAPGEVDERSIEDVSPVDLMGFTQCHFFAGIGGWSYALRLAGWADDKPAWTGSCPCQPFSTTGKRKGFTDDRHLWPAFFWLIKQCRPANLFGEQVSSQDGLQWLDLVLSDLEAAQYTTAALDLCAAGAGAPHLRQRLWFLGNTLRPRAWGESNQRNGKEGATAGQRQESRRANEAGHTSENVSTLGNANSQDGGTDGSQPNTRANGWRQHSRPGEGFRHWKNAEWLPYINGKWRCSEPESLPLAHGVPNRMAKLRGYGNAIVPQVAALFIQTYMEYLEKQN
jgi:DNA (cytosine-5)-methyltransferase 1